MKLFKKTLIFVFCFFLPSAGMGITAQEIFKKIKQQASNEITEQEAQELIKDIQTLPEKNIDDPVGESKATLLYHAANYAWKCYKKAHDYQYDKDDLDEDEAEKYRKQIKPWLTIVTALINKGADLYQKNQNNRMPLDILWNHSELTSEVPIELQYKDKKDLLVSPFADLFKAFFDAKTFDPKKQTSEPNEHTRPHLVLELAEKTAKIYGQTKNADKRLSETAEKIAPKWLNIIKMLVDKGAKIGLTYEEKDASGVLIYYNTPLISILRIDVPPYYDLFEILLQAKDAASAVDQYIYESEITAENTKPPETTLLHFLYYKYKKSVDLDTKNVWLKTIKLFIEKGSSVDKKNKMKEKKIDGKDQSVLEIAITEEKPSLNLLKILIPASQQSPETLHAIIDASPLTIDEKELINNAKPLTTQEDNQLKDLLDQQSKPKMINENKTTTPEQEKQIKLLSVLKTKRSLWDDAQKAKEKLKNSSTLSAEEKQILKKLVSEKQKPKGLVVSLNNALQTLKDKLRLLAQKLL